MVLATAVLFLSLASFVGLLFDVTRWLSLIAVVALIWRFPLSAAVFAVLAAGLLTLKWRSRNHVPRRLLH